MKIVFLEESTLTATRDIDFSCLEELGDYVGYPASTEAEAVERSAGTEVVVVNKVPMTAAFMDALPDLRLIAVIATGYNNVDLGAASERGIKVCNVFGYAEHTVPQHTFALILNLVTNVHRYHTEVQAGKWLAAGTFTLMTYPVFELAGKTLGIIGLGVIGTGTARIAEGFGMKVLANDIKDISGSGYENTALDQLLRESDIVTVHTPLTDLTRDMIGAAEIEKMKRTAFLINTARGGIVNEQALADALNTGRLAGAGFDVLSVEPPQAENPLFSAKNLVLTPHSAWSAVEARQKLVDETAENIRAYQGGRDRNIVN
jgi:glycerate dehydrogenase